MGKVLKAAKAKQIMREALAARGLPDYRLTARTVYFTDLARGSGLFVKIHGWQPNPWWDELRAIAVEAGFRIETDGGF